MNLEKELRRRRPAARRRRFPQTRKAFRQILQQLAKRHSRPRWLVENTLREKGLAYTLNALASPEPPRRGLLDRLRRLWSRS